MFSSSPRVTPVYAGRKIQRSSNPFFGALIDVSSGSNSYLHLDDLYSSHDYVATNTAKQLLTSQISGTSTAESFVITDLEGSNLLSFYKNTASEFEIADRMGHNIFAPSEDNSNTVKVSRYSTSSPLANNSASNIMSEDNMYGSPKLFASHTVDGNDSIISVFSFSKGEIQILHFDLNIHHLLLVEIL